MLKHTITTAILLTLPLGIFGAERPQTRQAALTTLSQTFSQQLDARRNATYDRLRAASTGAQARLNASRDVELMFVDDRGRPRFYQINNLNAARTVNTDDVWPGGSGGFSLSGSTTVLGELGIWDGGGVLTSHQEFGGRVTQQDSPGSTHYHATHVAGTMVAGGYVAGAQGMSYQANLAAYDWSNDESEMASAAAAGMNISNHSYGFVVGWRWDTDWYWYGDVDISTTEDYGFGYYGSYVQELDEIAYNAPYYLICKSAGNDRNDFGPDGGEGHYFWDPTASDWTWSTDTRDIDCGPDGYDCIGWKGNAKNILTVAAVDDISSGWSTASDVVTSSFTSWGPTDDGRIKPDIAANGIGLYSPMDGDDADYGSLNGTSMSSPNASGSLNLLVRHYESTHSAETPLASTVKALAIHTANEGGPNPGPDYMFGWGLLNTSGAAQHISDDVLAQGLIVEASLTNGTSHEYTLTSGGTGPLRITIVWTDPAGTPPAAPLNSTDLMLVHDLDLRLEHNSSSTVYLPYVLDPANPADAATTGDNVRDNVEQIHVASPTAGSYTVTVSHKGTLGATQYYSILASEALVSCPDSDGDGVCDADDICPGFDDLADADGDGVPDGCDGCPNDVNKTAPGVCGCGIADDDSDGDGVPDCNDICPGYDDNVDADADGVPDGCDVCEGHDDGLDADDDTVPDGCDLCPGFNDLADADSDGVPDGCDGCPNDVNKTEPGQCGCGIADDDSDADGVADCNDICPGHDDAVDPDADGLPTGCDNCPDDYNPLQEDVNENSIGDVCETCCRERVGDANYSGEDEPTIGDVTVMIDALFIGGDWGVIPCLPEADINKSGGLDPAQADITIGDVAYLIDYLFIGGTTLGLPDCIE